MERTYSVVNRKDWKRVNKITVNVKYYNRQFSIHQCSTEQFNVTIFRHCKSTFLHLDLYCLQFLNHYPT
jgi:hypothetical protein